MLPTSSLSRVLRPAWASVLLGLGVGLLPTVALPQASTRWVVEPRTSLAWWQVNPTLNHLWATTCTADRGWRPGEGRSAGWDITSNSLKLPKTGYANVSDTVHVPLYPRVQVHAVCQQAVSGHIEVADTAHWRGIHGLVVVRVAALTTGEAMRDEMMREILNAAQYQDFLFQLDSVVDLTKVADTLVGRAVGMLTVRAIPRPLTAAVKAFPDSGGMRVLAKFRIPANDLHDYTPSINTVGLGVNTKLWKDFFFGIDIVLRPPNGTAGE